MSGKGSNPRPFSVDQKTFANNWDAIFKKDNTMSETEKTGTCGCGRSPTGDCIGWHNLTEDSYQHYKRLWVEEQFRKDYEADEESKK
jgi:hypothetical protein